MNQSTRESNFRVITLHHHHQNSLILQSPASHQSQKSFVKFFAAFHTSHAANDECQNECLIMQNRKVENNCEPEILLTSNIREEIENFKIGKSRAQNIARNDICDLKAKNSVESF
jgi:hypothetical protein